jgi:hypothetical protein
MTSPCSLLPEACLQFGEGELRNGFWQRLPPTLLLTLMLIRKVRGNRLDLGIRMFTCICRGSFRLT